MSGEKTNYETRHYVTPIIVSVFHLTSDRLLLLPMENNYLISSVYRNDKSLIMLPNSVVIMLKGKDVIVFVLFLYVFLLPGGI